MLTVNRQSLSVNRCRPHKINSFLDSFGVNINQLKIND
jgi:hypothetical protein